jgi:hypothetical protein
MSGAIPPLPNRPSWRGVQLKHRDNFTFTFNNASALWFKVLAHHYPRKLWENHEKPQPEQPIAGLRFEPEASPI